jgi:hypothetical protein
MIALLPPLVAAAAVMIVLLCTSPKQVSGEPKTAGRTRAQ